MGYFLGLDQGGTKTLAAVADRSGRILGLGRASGACHSYQGMARATQAAAEAWAGALNSAGITVEEIEAVWAGMAGADWPEDYTALRTALQAMMGISRIEIRNDCLIAMRGGTHASYGAVLCAGTEFNAAVRSPDGREYIFGYYVQEEDLGGKALARKTIQAVLAAEAGLAPQTALTEMVLNLCSHSSVDGLLHELTTRGRPIDDAALVRTLFTAAEGGDPVSVEILRTFGGRLANYAVSGLHRFDMLHLEIDVVLSGGIFKAKTRALKEAVAAGIHASAPGARIVEAAYEPVIGAVLMALDDYHGRPLPEEVMRNIASSSAEWGLLRSEQD